MAADHTQGGYITSWHGTASGLDVWEERVKLYIVGTKKDDKYLCGPRILNTLNPESDESRTAKERVSSDILIHERGEGALAVVRAVRNTLGPASIQEGARLAKLFFKGASLYGQFGEGMRKFTTRFQSAYFKLGTTLPAACSDIDTESSLHHLLLGIFLLDCCGLEPSEQSAVLATSG